MQAVSDEQARLLRSAAVAVDFGAELLTPKLQVVRDISDDLRGGLITRNMNRTPHGQCQLQLSQPLTWGVDLVRPYMTLTDTTTGTTARWGVGVFALTTPQAPVGESPVTYDVAGFDRLYLLNRDVGMEYSVAAGTSYRTALLNVFAAAGLSGVLLEGAAAESTLPAARVWSLVGLSTDPDQTSTPATWLRIVNDLLAAINFRAVWADQDGLFRCQAYQAPTERAAEFTFTADDPTVTILGESRTVVEDVWRTPNRWVFRQTNRPSGAPTATEGNGLYTFANQSDGPTSIGARGLVWPRVVDLEAATQAKLVELGDRRVAYDRRRTASYTVTTGPFPPAGHADVFDYIDLAAGGARKVQAVEWSMPLDGTDVQWQWEAVA